MEIISQITETKPSLFNEISISNLAKAYKIPKELFHINKDQAVLELLMNCSTLSKHMTKKETDDILSRIASKVVISINEPTRLYQIESISFDKNPNNTVIPYNKLSYTLLHYYSSIQNIPIKFKSQPLLIAKLLSNKHQNKQVYLLPEVSYEVSIDINKLFQHLSTKKHKENNNKSIQDKGREDNSSNYLMNSKLTLDNILNKYIEINVGDDKAKVNTNTNMNDSCSNISLEATSEIEEYKNKANNIQSNLKTNKWLIFYDKHSEWKTNQTTNKLLKAGKKITINIEEPLMHGMFYKPKESNFSQSICDELELILNKKEHFFNMILIILPNKDAYHYIKRYCIEKLGIMTQILIETKIRQAKPYYTSVLMQMYHKTGNDVFRIKFKKEESQLMICGITIGNFVSETEINGTIAQEYGVSLSMVSSYDEHYAKYHFEHINDSDPESFEQKLNVIIANSFENYSNMNDERSPLKCVVYIQKEAIHRSNKIEYSIIKKVFNMLSTALDARKVSYAIIETDHLKRETLKSKDFSVMKYNNELASYYTVLSNNIFTLSQLYALTMKLTYYNWIKVCLVPSCLIYSRNGNKMFQTCKINSVHGKLRNEPFYL